MSEEQNIKYFIYARKSSESEDRQMESITDQLKVLQDIAKRRGLEIVEVFKESKSAKNPGREQFTEMMDRISKGEAGGILCWKLNRLARNTMDGGLLSHLLQNNVIQKIVTTDRDYHPLDNILMMQVEFGMATQFINDLRKDTKRGLQSKAERGWYPSHAPLGYTHDPLKKKGEKEIVIDELRFSAVRKIFDLVLAGTHNPRQALKHVTNTVGLRSVKGTKVSQSTIYAIMRNPFYYGRFEYPKGSGNWYDGKHEPMLTKEEFDLIQSKIDPSYKPSHKVKKEFTFRGPMKCGECGAKITAERKTKRQKNGNVHKYTYYHCTGRKDPNCTQGVIEESPLAEEMAESFGKITITEGAYTWALETLKEMVESDKDSGEYNSKRVRHEVGQVDKRLDALLDLKLNGSINEEMFLEKKRVLEKDKEELNALLNSQQDEQKDIPVKAETYLNLARDMQVRFENGTPEERRRLYLSVGPFITLADKKLDMDLPSPLGVVSELVTYIDKNSKVQSALKMFEPQQKTAQTYSLSDSLRSAQTDFSMELSEPRTNVRTSKKLSVKRRPEYKVLTSQPLLRGRDSKLQPTR